MFTTLRFRSLDDMATDQAQELLAKASHFRLEGKPEKWARDIERKALRKMEHSFILRHLLDRRYADRPSVLPPSSYSYDPK